MRIALLIVVTLSNVACAGKNSAPLRNNSILLPVVNCSTVGSRAPPFQRRLRGSVKVAASAA